jgi:hypothetical protein
MGLTDELPEDLPPEPEWRREMASVDHDFATARRLIMFSNAGDHVALNAVMCEVERSGRGAKVLMALTVQAATFGQHLYGPFFAEWIERAALNQLDVAQADRRELDGE